MAKSKKTNSKKKTTTSKKSNSSKAVKETVVKEDIKKEEKTKKEKKVTPKKVEKVENDKKSLWVKFRIFCHGVVAETKKIHWPNKAQVLKYSIATIVFVVFLALFFYLIDVIFAAVQALFK